MVALRRANVKSAGLRLADLVVIGITAAIGFTVSLFFATAAFPAGAALAGTKMGALLSFSAAPFALVASRLLEGAGRLNYNRLLQPLVVESTFNRRSDRTADDSYGRAVG